jgi:hypothetical protein
MAFVIFEPALLAALLAGTSLLMPGAPVAATGVAVASPCNSAAASTAGFDCCVRLAGWTAPAPTPPNHSASVPLDDAADQKEGR